MTDVKCPRCEQTAALNDATEEVHCAHCGYSAQYPAYLEAMRARMERKVVEYQGYAPPSGGQPDAATD